MKNTVLEKEGVTRIQSEVAYLGVHRIGLSLRKSQGRTPKLTAAGHESHAAVRSMKIRQAVTDLDAHQGQRLVSKVSRNPNIAVPPASKGRRIGFFRSLIDEGG